MSAGTPIEAPVRADETNARDAVTLLDSLGIEHAVLVDRWPRLPTRLAEQHPDRVAGLVILRATPEPDPVELRRRDPTGVLEMQDRVGAAIFDLPPGAVPWRDNHYEPRYVRVVRISWHLSRYARHDPDAG